MLQDNKSGRLLRRIRSFFGPELQTREVWQILPIGMGQRVPERAYRIISEKDTALLCRRASRQFLAENVEARFSQIYKTDVILRDYLGANNCRVRIGGVINDVHPLLKSS